MIKLKNFILIIVVLFISCGESLKKDVDKKEDKPSTAINEDVKKSKSRIAVYNYDELAPLLHKKDTEKTYVINFWATWCKPCVDELPVFEKLREDYKDKNVEVLLVSLDFPDQIEEQLIPFIKNNKIQSKVVVLDDPDQNKWINAIDKTWSGALPATLIYNQKQRAFFEQSFDEEKLLKEVQKIIN